MKPKRKIICFFVVLIGLTAAFGILLLTSHATYKATAVVTAQPVTNAITSESFRTDILKSVPNIHNVRVETGECMMILTNGTRKTVESVSFTVTCLSPSKNDTAGSAIASRVNSISGCKAWLGTVDQAQPHRWYDDTVEAVTRFLE
jgi:hypothetical protein